MHPPTSRATILLTLLGSAQIVGSGVQLERLERKTAGLLAYLAIEGPTARSKLAGLLWPNSVEATARNNLAQVLRRLKQATQGLELVTGGDSLGLQGVGCDATTLEVAHFAGHHPSVVEISGVLLEGYEYDDCPEFEDWLLAQRVRLLELSHKSRAALSEAEEAKANYPEALHHAELLLVAESLSEVAHRRVMRLRYLQGDRAAALAAYHRCQAVLKKELGLEPLPETRALAQMIETGKQVAAEVIQPKTIPLSVLRPPLLIGREREWRQLEAAWQQGQGIVIAGEPGIGKSRLLLDFVGSKGPYEMLEGRPGDAAVAYAAYVRSFRRILTRHQDLELEEWVRKELSRLIPELWSETPSPIQSEAEKLRFFEAAVWIFAELQRRGLQTICGDDLQFMDVASFELAQYILSRLGDSGLRLVSAYRVGELSPDLEAGMRQSVEAGKVYELRLDPLGVEAITQLLESLHTEDNLGGLGQPLSRYTGGNPMFVLETLKNLYETGQVAHGLPERLPPAGKIGPLIQRRLERLSTAALRLAYTAAVAGVDFSLELAASVLDKHPLDLAQDLAELEATQVLRGNAFAHDLIYEGTLAGIPVSVKVYLHRRVADYLEKTQADPALVAKHWLEGQEPARAAPFVLKAAEASHATYRLSEAASRYDQTANLYQQLGDNNTAFDALYKEALLLQGLGVDERFARVIDQMFFLASNKAQEAEAWRSKCALLYAAGDAEAFLVAARQGLECALESGNRMLEGRFAVEMGAALYTGGSYDEALQYFAQASAIGAEIGLKDLYAGAEYSLAVVYYESNRVAQSIPHIKNAEQAYLEMNSKLDYAVTCMRFASLYFDMGDVRGGQPKLLEAQHNMASIDGALDDKATLSHWIALSYFLQDDYSLNLQTLEAFLDSVKGVQLGFTGRTYADLARTLLRLGATEEARVALEQAIHYPGYPNGYRLPLFTLQLQLSRQLGLSTDSAIEQAEAYRHQVGGRTVQVVQYLMQKALLSADPAGLYQEAWALAQKAELYGCQIGLNSRGALLALETGDSALALAQSHEAMRLLDRYEPYLYRGEILLNHYRVLQQANPDQAASHLKTTLHWLYETAENKVPLQYRQSFLSQNPINRAILEAAKEAGLSVP